MQCPNVCKKEKVHAEHNAYYHGFNLGFKETCSHVINSRNPKSTGCTYRPLETTCTRTDLRRNNVDLAKLDCISSRKCVHRIFPNIEARYGNVNSENGNSSRISTSGRGVGEVPAGSTTCGVPALNENNETIG